MVFNIKLFTYLSLSFHFISFQSYPTTTSYLSHNRFHPFLAFSFLFSFLFFSFPHWPKYIRLTSVLCQSLHSLTSFSFINLIFIHFLQYALFSIFPCRSSGSCIGWHARRSIKLPNRKISSQTYWQRYRTDWQRCGTDWQWCWANWHWKSLYNRSAYHDSHSYFGRTQ